MVSRALFSKWKDLASPIVGLVCRSLSKASQRWDAWFNLACTPFAKWKSSISWVLGRRGRRIFASLLGEDIQPEAVVRRAYEMASDGFRFLEKGDVDNALSSLRKCLQIFPDSIEHAEFLSASILPALAVTELQGFGRYDAAQTLFRESQLWMNAFARDHDLPIDNKLYLSNFWIANIGHLAAIGAFVKRGIIEGDRMRGLTLSLSPGSPAVNKCLYSHWGKYGITTLATDLPISMDVLRHVEKKIFIFEYPNGVPRYYWESMADVHRDWAVLGLPPLLVLSDEEIVEGRKALSRLGMPPNAWFVCLHVRASGFKGAHESLHASLNADIETYVPMMTEITARGGWVIRMGDPSMPKMLPMEGVIDYAHSPQKSESMDVFLCAHCRFYVGTSSGLGFVPPLFGTPCVFTNWFPVGTRPFQPNDLYIIKLHWSEWDNELVPFAETLSPPLGHIHSMDSLRKNGLALKDNTPEEITEVTLEMYERIVGGGEGYRESDNRLQDSFNAVAKTNRCYGSAQLGRAFLRRYAHLLPPSNIENAQ